MSYRELQRELDRLRKMSDPHLYDSLSDLQRSSREREAELLESLEKMKRRTWNLRENVKSQKTECKERLKEMRFQCEREQFLYEMKCENEMWKHEMKIAKRSADEAIRNIESMPDPSEETDECFEMFNETRMIWNEQREKILEIVEDMSDDRFLRDEMERTARERDEKEEALKTLRTEMQNSEKEMEAEIKDLKEKIECLSNDRGEKRKADVFEEGEEEGKEVVVVEKKKKKKRKTASRLKKSMTTKTTNEEKVVMKKKEPAMIKSTITTSTNENVVMKKKEPVIMKNVTRKRTRASKKKEEEKQVEPLPEADETLAALKNLLDSSGVGLNVPSNKEALSDSTDSVNELKKFLDGASMSSSPSKPSPLQKKNAVLEEKKPEEIAVVASLKAVEAKKKTLSKEKKKIDEVTSSLTKGTFETAKTENVQQRRSSRKRKKPSRLGHTDNNNKTEEKENNIMKDKENKTTTMKKQDISSPQFEKTAKKLFSQNKKNQDEHHQQQPIKKKKKKKISKARALVNKKPGASFMNVFSSFLQPKIKAGVKATKKRSTRRKK